MMSAGWFALGGKTVDLTLTSIGLALGCVEMNPRSLTPLGLFLCLIVLPAVLSSVETLAEKWGFQHRWILLLPGAMAWVPVGWNLGVMLL
jgi:hypothetical protein